MPHVTTPDGVKLHYEEAGKGHPVLFVHEFAGDLRSWEPQLRHFSRRYRVIAYNARGYPPSDVPPSVESYSQQHAADDIAHVLNALNISRAHVVGCSMGAFASIHFGLRHASLATSIVPTGAGYGAPKADHERFQKEAAASAERIAAIGMAEFGKTYMSSPSRAAFRAKDPRGAEESMRFFTEHSAQGSSLTMKGYQARRPSLYDFEAGFKAMKVPTLLVVGDEDHPALEANLFMKRSIPTAGLVVLPRTGHACNLEEPDLYNRLVDDFFHTVECGRWVPQTPPAASILDLGPDMSGTRK